MVANTTPIYSKEGKISWNTSILKTANTALDGTGTVQTVFTAGTNGSRVERIRIKPLGTNIATLLRVFINNGNDQSVASNNVLYAEKVVSSYTLSQTASYLQVELPDTTDATCFPIVLPAGYKINVAIGTTVATGIQVTAIGSDY